MQDELTKQERRYHEKLEDVEAGQQTAEKTIQEMHGQIVELLDQLACKDKVEIDRKKTKTVELNSARLQKQVNDLSTELMQK